MTDISVPDALPILSKGHHDILATGRGCLMDSISWLSGKPEEGDAPSCVHPVLRSVAIRVNDRLPDSERHRLWRLVPDLIGTADEREDDRARRELCVRLAVWCARRVLPLVRPKDRRVCEAAIRAAEGWCDGTVSEAECRDAASAAYDAADRAAYAHANAAAYAAARVAAACAAYAASVGCAAYASAADAAGGARLEFLEGLVAEHRRLTSHKPTPVTVQQWGELTEMLGVVNG